MKDNLPFFAQNRNVQAFLWMLRYGEGTQSNDGYRIIFGGSRFFGPDNIPDTFDDFSDHPKKLITKTLRGGIKITSSAAGAYQFLKKTWASLVKQYGFLDFSPANQDLGAIALIAGRGALSDVVAGRIQLAISKCNLEWASLPGSPYGQPVVTLDECLREYLEAGGQFHPQPTPTDDKDPEHRGLGSL